ncbi:hypothetical protein CDL15_Pgr021230 [Punica granatum]|uniref:Uncharacterized protein n=1 Tax=Punica granatum TaxID=22663 RepID=A0A218WQV1_PUNGR|nr:hypothetical protein CDL15_Pgr021230 [Punica granatum]
MRSSGMCSNSSGKTWSSFRNSSVAQGDPREARDGVGKHVYWCGDGSALELQGLPQPKKGSRQSGSWLREDEDAGNGDGREQFAAGRGRDSEEEEEEFMEVITGGEGGVGRRRRSRHYRDHDHDDGSRISLSLARENLRAMASPAISSRQTCVMKSK